MLCCCGACPSGRSTSSVLRVARRHHRRRASFWSRLLRWRGWHSSVASRSKIRMGPSFSSSSAKGRGSGCSHGLCETKKYRGRFLVCPRQVLRVDANASASEPPAAGHTATRNISDKAWRDDVNPGCSVDPLGPGRKAPMARRRDPRLTEERYLPTVVHHRQFHGTCVLSA